MASSEKVLLRTGEGHCALKGSLSISAPPDSTYVDLQDLLDHARSVQVSFRGDGDGLAFIKSSRSAQDPISKDVIQCVRFPSAPSLPVFTRKCVNLDCWGKGRTAEATDTDSSDGGKFTHCSEWRTGFEGNNPGSEHLELTHGYTTCNLRTTNSCISRKGESDDEVSVLITDYCDDEAHFITTHEIQLSELDHDVDGEIASPCSWDLDDDHQVYSFVDYASFDSDETVGGQVENGAVEVTCNQAESDPLSAANCARSETAAESPSQSAGHIHLSIKTTSRAINEPSNVQEKDGDIHHAAHTGDIDRCVIRDSKVEKINDGAKCLIALPGRLHIGSKSKGKGKDAADYSSGTSSAVSELDDADKEVRNLTARAFRSLAYPYLDAINFSTSSESSASEHGLGVNRWSALVDLKYGNVNTSKAGDHNIASRQNAPYNFQLAKRSGGNGITGLTLTSRRAPPVEIFALNGNLVNPQTASSKKIELMGKFGQTPAGVIRLTETLNFRCNVKAGPPANEKRAKSARCARGSRSADEVTSARPGARSRPPCNSEDAMEDSHKKSIFASSLLKNVISKKMQFEQERKMERGEICEPAGPSPPCAATPDLQTQRDRATVQRQSSKVSETGSDFTIVCLDELGDIVDSGSCEPKNDEPKSPKENLDLEATPGAPFDAKKGASDASRSVLIRSQNSAFRSWRDDEHDVQTESKNQRTSPDATNSTLTKMSSLFVPSIQRLSSDGELTKPEPSTKYERIEGTDRNQTLYVSDPGQNAVASRSPEIKISLRSLKDSRSDAFSIAKLLTPNIGCNAGGMVKAGDESKYQALTAALKNDSSDRIPHFTVRDVRDKGKLQAPIHQVRDVRKLVKSSYHFVSLDKTEKGNSAELEHKISKQKRNPAALSPIVIKCQSVNTNTNVKQTGNCAESVKDRLVEDVLEADASYPTAPTEDIKMNETQLSSENPESPTALTIETRSTSKKQDKAFDSGEKKTDSKMVAFEKLQAAVKTMEQLYTFDRNEWKRKSEPHPITDSHVLSLISSEEHRGPEQEQVSDDLALATIRRDSFTSLDQMQSAGPQSTNKGDKERVQMSPSSVKHEKLKGTKTLMHLGGAPRRSISTLSHSQKSSVPISSSVKALQVHDSPHVSLSSTAVTPKSPRLPVSVKITQSKPAMEHRERPDSNETGFIPVQFTSSTDSQNYITIPVKPQPTAATQSHPGLGTTKIPDVTHKSPKHTSIAMETRSPDTPTATIYHHPLPITMQAAQPQVICFSPTVQHSPVPTDPFHPTQRKMLLDPTTGNYYLVDTPVQPATRRLFDPETGQYVDVPMPQQPPMTPVPMPISPLALSPGGFGHTYMFYPGYMATTVIPARTIQSQLSVQSDGEAGDKAQQREESFMESPYYMPSGKSLQSTSGAQHIPTGKTAINKVPVISITSQQGPRIIAPPSFDGTTMSFVVEHR